MVDETAADGERLEALLQNFLRDGPECQPRVPTRPNNTAHPVRLSRRPRRRNRAMSPPGSVLC